MICFCRSASLTFLHCPVSFGDTGTKARSGCRPLPLCTSKDSHKSQSLCNSRKTESKQAASLRSGAVKERSRQWVNAGLCTCLSTCPSARAGMTMAPSGGGNSIMCVLDFFFFRPNKMWLKVCLLLVLKKMSSQTANSSHLVLLEVSLVLLYLEELFLFTVTFCLLSTEITPTTLQYKSIFCIQKYS